MRQKRGGRKREKRGRETKRRNRKRRTKEEERQAEGNGQDQIDTNRPELDSCLARAQRERLEKNR